VYSVAVTSVSKRYSHAHNAAKTWLITAFNDVDILSPIVRALNRNLGKDSCFPFISA